MEHRLFGKTGLNVSVLGLGGSEIGTSDYPTVERLLHAALDAGLNVIDTAECYGESEEFIGRAVSDRRSDFTLFTKCGHTSGLPGEDWDPDVLTQSIDRSLQRLRTDCVDLLQLHTCDETKLREGDVIAVLQRARDAGKTRFIGYSGDGAPALYAVQCKAFDTLQTSINIADQEAILLTLPDAAKNHMGVIAKRPVANIAWHNGAGPPDQDYARPYWERLQRLKYDFLSRADMDSAVSIALRFAIAQPGVHIAIVGTQNPERWAQNSALVDRGPLPPDVVAGIRRQWLDMAGDDWTGQT